ncbi:MAG TPA: FHA domain-containing protein [Candidatus Hydrogenedentes bacterium]|nr:FHA domain-containing protein [Candidatus Hydrogenedentota bacterium]HOK89521.1 FHA domain-containing protein [Candidatus Hydrogenedentota bacterium]
MRYVKRCPRCGTINDELDGECAQCGEFLGLVAAVPEPEVAAGPDRPAPEAKPVAPVIRTSPTTESATLYLEHASGSRWPIHPGQTVGQAWPEQGPDVAIEGLPGTRYLHRRHCRFIHENGGWWVEPLPQEHFVNPTLVNGNPVMPGVRAALHNGDRLTLSGLDFTIRMLAT